MVDSVGIGYRELSPRRKLCDYLACVWSLRPAECCTEKVLPDGCMDIVWRDGIGLTLAGPDTAPVPVSRLPGSTVGGVRFRPGAAPAMLGVPASELRDQRVPLAELWGSAAERLEARLEEAGSAERRRGLLQHELVRRLADAGRPDPMIKGAVAALRANGLRRVDGLGGALGLSERQLRRRFHSAVGYGPKTLARVLRFQRLLALGSRPRRDGLARLALDAGYADQHDRRVHASRRHAAGPPPCFARRSRI